MIKEFLFHSDTMTCKINLLMKFIWLLLLPCSLFAQSTVKKSAKVPNLQPQFYVFGSLTMDDFVTTSPEKGGTVIYNYDSTGLKIDGEIEINPVQKFIEIIYTGDKKHPMKAMLEGKPEYNNDEETYTYKAHWMDTNEKTEITMSSGDSVAVIKVLFGPHKGDYAKYWDRIYKYKVSKKP